MASFIISEEGEIIEPMIESSSHPDFDAPTLRAIRRWRYKPALLEGKPVEQSMVQTIIRYHLEDSKGATRKFIQQYREISALLTARAFADTVPLLQALEDGELNFYEDAWLGWLQYVYLEATGTGTREALIKMLERALGNSDAGGGNYLEPDMFVSASQRLYALHVRAGDLGNALSVFERLAASESAKRSDLYADVMASLEPVQLDIQKLMAGPRVLQQVGRVEQNGYWVHRLLRRSFAFGDVRGGALDVVDLRCTRANRRVPAVADAILRVPASWGDCRAYVRGDVGATFAFEEYAEEGVASAPPSSAL